MSRLVIGISIGLAIGFFSVAASNAACAAEQSGPAGERVHQFSWGTFELAPRIAEKMKAGKKQNMVVDVEGAGIPIQGAEMRIGMKRGCKKAAVGGNALECCIAGPVTPDPARQLAELETLLNSGEVDCLAIQPPLPSHRPPGSSPQSPCPCPCPGPGPRRAQLIVWRAHATVPG
jgi:ribose transport system substrate-binding protein